MGQWMDEAPSVQERCASADADASWKRHFAENMQHVEHLYDHLPTLNVIRATALVGAMQKTKEQSTGTSIYGTGNP